MRTYRVAYIMDYYQTEREIDVLANNAGDAYDKAAYEEIPKKEGGYPYGAYVKSVTYNNGKHKYFNNLIGKPY